MIGLDLVALINAAPEPLRAYIHDLETNADPASNIRDAHVQRENADALAVRVRELEQENGALKRVAARVFGDLEGVSVRALLSARNRLREALR